MNYYHIILNEQKKTVGGLALRSVPWLSYSFMKWRKQAFLLMRTRDTQFCSAISTVLRHLGKLYIRILGLFITVAIGSLFVFVCMHVQCVPACVLAFAFNYEFAFNSFVTHACRRQTHFEKCVFKNNYQCSVNCL